jgi:hypothetical protein
LAKGQRCAEGRPLPGRRIAARKRRSLDDAVGHPSVSSTPKRSLNLPKSMAVHRPMLSFVHLSCMPAHRSRTSHPSTAAEDGRYLFRRMSIGGPLQSSGPRQSGCSCAETRGSPPISDLPDSVTGGCEPLNDLAFPDHRINRATASIRTAN